MTGMETTKPDALLNVNRKTERSAQILLGPGQIAQIDRPSIDGSAVYDISRAGMHPGEPENHRA
jgi:hypothetical protein